MMIHTKELTLRVRANEKVVASVSLLGVIACTFIGAGYFAPKAEAGVTDKSFNAGQLIQDRRDWEAEKTRTSPEEVLNSALIMEDKEYGCDDPTESEELLHFPSDQDQQGDRWRHDRRDPGPWGQPDQERESENCRCGHPREENEEFRGESTLDCCIELAQC